MEGGNRVDPPLPSPMVELTSIQTSIPSRAMGFSMLGGVGELTMVQPAVIYASASQTTDVLQANNAITLVFRVNVRLRSTSSPRDTSRLQMVGSSANWGSANSALYS